MKKGYLSEYFVDIGYKRLSAVEALRHRSNQHEFDGVAMLKRMLGTVRRTFPAGFIYLADDDPEPVVDSGFLTWYDSREKQTHRSAEYRLYFPDTTVSERANEGDLLIIGRRPDDSMQVIIAAAGSTSERQVSWLFGLDGVQRAGYAVKSEEEADHIRMEFASRIILEQIGIEAEVQDENFLETMLESFHGKFPTTRVFSEFARGTLNGLCAHDDPDDVLVAWLDREEVLFRTLERHLIGDRLKEGFADDVDTFISFSLSVQNRRKSRAGSALENHLEFLFNARGIRHRRTAVTEGRSKPDFLFPGHAEYHDPGFSPMLLTMLGVKSSCKERWRQVLAEAARIEQKHLLTLEPGITENQTGEMQAHGVSLVLPRAIHVSYTPTQQAWLMDVGSFVGLVLERQGGAAT